MPPKGPAEPAWWSARWQTYLLEDLQGWLPPESKLRAAARAEVRLAVEKGKVIARVNAGSYGQVCTATAKVKPLGEREWRRVIDTLAADAAAAHRFLAGDPGPELEAVFAAADVSLFPAPAVKVPVRCTCREGWGCRHINVLAVHGGQMFAGNPFLWLEVLGRPRPDLLAAVRARIANRTALGDRADCDMDPEGFWEAGLDPEAIAVRPGSAPSAGGLLRMLGPLPLSDEAATLGDFRAEELLKQFAVHIGRSAADLARGEISPAYREEALPGKAVPLKARLVAEVEEAVSREGAVMRIDQIRAACPTAAAAPPGAAESALREALLELPPELVSILGYWAGPRAAVLEGAAFRHTVSFGEWHSGCLSFDADWVRAIRLGAGEPPFTVRAAGRLFAVPEPQRKQPSGLLAALGARVGDELHLAVADPAQPLLTATLHRREAHGSPAGLLHEANRAATGKILEHMRRTRAGRLPEVEAVAVLLAEGSYRSGQGPDPAWLLGAQREGLYGEGRSRSLTCEPWYAHRPQFGRPVYGRDYWQGQESAIGSFGIAYAQAGAGRRGMEAAVNAVRFWCEHFGQQQNQPGHTAPLGALLHFLWQVGPLEAQRRRVDAELLPEYLGAWFAWLVAQNPRLKAGYEPHIAACGLMDAQAHRLATLPRGRGSEPDLRAWHLEGFRWMGAELYHA